MVWPPRSPDMTPADFFVWPYLKEKIRRRSPPDVAAVKQCIAEKFLSINNNELQKSRNACQSVYVRVVRCIQNIGGHF